MSKKMDHDLFPMGAAFLIFQESIADECSQATDKFAAEAGKSVPATLEELGSVLSILYRVATCQWGCNTSDHQIEWLIGRVVNHGCGAYHLIRSANYDESLVLTRGIGEMGNLFCVFKTEPDELVVWKTASRRERLNRFNPAAMRKKIKQHGNPAFIDDDRYRRLCEVGAHPVPGFAPGHYSGTGRPILNGIVQEGGVFVCLNELGFAVSLAAHWCLDLVSLPADVKKQLFERATKLMRVLGAFNITNYEELLKRALEENAVRGETAG